MSPELKSQIEHSGNNLHLKVVQFLEDHGWITELSPYYYDDTDNKPREIDIIAWKNIEVHSLGGENLRPVEEFKVFLFVECKYLKEDFAFRMRPFLKNIEAFKIEGFDKDKIVGEIHGLHLLNINSVGKLYDAENKNIQREIFDGLTQPVKSLTFFRDRNNENGFYFPITVIEGPGGMYKIPSGYDNKNLDKLTAEQYLPAELNYSYRRPSNGTLQTEYFLVEFVRFDFLETFVGAVDKDIALLKNYFVIRHRLDDRS